MHNIPEVTLATAEAQAQQIYRIKNSDEVLDTMIYHFTELYKTNPILSLTIYDLNENLLSVSSIDKMNRDSKNPEEFSSKVQIAFLSIMYTILKMIDSQIEANQMKDMFQ